MSQVIEVRFDAAAKLERLRAEYLHLVQLLRKEPPVQHMDNAAWCKHLSRMNHVRILAGKLGRDLQADLRAEVL